MHGSMALLSEIERFVHDGAGWDAALDHILHALDADSGTIHLLEPDGLLHLKAASAGIPPTGWRWPLPWTRKA